MERASRLSAHRPVRPPGRPSIFPSSACVLRVPESCILLRYANDVTFSVSCTEWQLHIICIYQNTLLRLNTGAFDIIAVTLGGSVTQTSVVSSAPHPPIFRSIILVEVCSTEIPVFPCAFYSVLNASLFFHVQMFVAVFNILSSWSLKCNCERHWNLAFLAVWVPALNVWKWPLYRIRGCPNSLFCGLGFHEVLFGYENYFSFQNIPPFLFYSCINQVFTVPFLKRYIGVHHFTNVSLVTVCKMVNTNIPF